MATKSSTKSAKRAAQQDEHWEVQYTDHAGHDRHQNLFSEADAHEAANSHVTDGFTNVAIDKVTVAREAVAVKLVEPDDEVSDEVS
jgi:hypothetical protein